MAIMKHVGRPLMQIGLLGGNGKGVRDTCVLSAGANGEREGGGCAGVVKGEGRLIKC